MNNLNSKYGKIASILREEIKENTLPDQTILSPRELQERFEVTSNTLNESMRILKREGLVSFQAKNGRKHYVVGGVPPENLQGGSAERRT